MHEDFPDAQAPLEAKFNAHVQQQKHRKPTSPSRYRRKVPILS